MKEATEVPMICMDCGGSLTDDDLYWTGLTNRGVMHMTYSQCFDSLNERLTAATQRAEALLVVNGDLARDNETLEAECEALLSVIERVRPSIHLDAALAVQSTTGESK